MTLTRRPFLLTLAAWALAPVAGAVQAHSKKEATVPVDGAVLPSPPEQIGITFDRPMRITLIRLRSADETEVPLQRSDDMAPVTRFTAVPGALEPGTYTVEWRGLSDDGHPMQGRFSFEIRP